MDRVLAYREPYDAVVLAGLRRARPRRPAGADRAAGGGDLRGRRRTLAMLIARSFSVVTTLQRSVPAIEDRLKLAGLADRCASVRASGMSTLEVDADPRGAIRGIVDAGQDRGQEDHAEAICLGCAGYGRAWRRPSPPNWASRWSTGSARRSGWPRPSSAWGWRPARSPRTRRPTRRDHRLAAVTPRRGRSGEQGLTGAGHDTESWTLPLAGSAAA